MASENPSVISAAREHDLQKPTVLAGAIRLTLGGKPKCMLTEKKRGRPVLSNGGLALPAEVALEIHEISIAETHTRLGMITLEP